MLEFILAFMFPMNAEFNRHEPLTVRTSTSLKVSCLSRVCFVSYPHSPMYVYPSLLAYPVLPEAVDKEREIRRELSIYPLSFIRYARLDRVVNCGAIYVQSDAGWERAVGVSIHEFHTLLIDSNHYPQELFIQILHHELYHFIDDQQGKSGCDVEWTNLNVPDFKYKTVHVDTLLNQPPQGFVTYYATSDAGEDKAETFAMMVSNPERVKQMVAIDSILERKVSFMKRRVKTICPEMDDAFWERISKQRSEVQISLDQIIKIESMRAERLTPAPVPVETITPAQDDVCVKANPMISSVDTWSNAAKLILILLALVSPLTLVILLRRSPRRVHQVSVVRLHDCPTR